MLQLIDVGEAKAGEQRRIAFPLPSPTSPSPAPSAPDTLTPQIQTLLEVTICHFIIPIPTLWEKDI
jgi:hypothetical protein